MAFTACAPSRTEFDREPPAGARGGSRAIPAEWEIRSSLWLSSHSAVPVKRKLRERSSRALTLCGHGMSLRVDAGTLLIRNGFTHHPQVREEYRYFRGDLDRPAKIIILDGSGSITFDVLDWLAEQDVPIIRISWTGEVVTLIGGCGYSADREKVDWQRATRACPTKRRMFSADLVGRKIDNSIMTLTNSIPKSDKRDRAVARMAADSAQLARGENLTVEGVRGIEGRAAASYFGAWHDVRLEWASSKKVKPVPVHWLTIGSRASLLAEKTSKNRNATHPLYAMLNYGYAVLLGSIKVQLTTEGYDPTIGIFHHDYRGGPAFALDLMESLRPVVDGVILKFALGHRLHAADFVIRTDGGVRLNPELARRLVEQVSELFGLHQGLARPVPGSWERVRFW